MATDVFYGTTMCFVNETRTPAIWFSQNVSAVDDWAGQFTNFTAAKPGKEARSQVWVEMQMQF